MNTLYMDHTYIKSISKCFSGERFVLMPEGAPLGAKVASFTLNNNPDIYRGVTCALNQVKKHNFSALNQLNLKSGYSKNTRYEGEGSEFAIGFSRSNHLYIQKRIFASLL